MENSLKIPLLRAMGNIYEVSKGCQLKEEIWSKLHDSLEVIITYFDVNRMQAFLIAHIYTHNYNENITSISRLAEYLECNPLQLLEYTSDLYKLAELGIIRKETSRRRSNNSLSNEELFLNPKIEEALLKDLPMPKPEPLETDCFITLIERVIDLEDELSDQKITGVSFIDSLDKLFDNNTHFPIIKEMNKQNVYVLDGFLFLKLVWEVLNGYNSLEVVGALRDILTQNSSRRIKYLQSFQKGSNGLQKLGWVKLRQSRFLNDAEIELDDKGILSLEAMGLHLGQKKKKKKDLLSPTNLSARKLFFNPRETEELGMLQSMLMETNFKRLRSRLKKKNLPQGLTVLFFGHPGTGKTESVLQMARKSGREIQKVDISQTKSMWFGESEKIIKKIFSDYRIMAEESKRMPILLFNEADAIISRRKDTERSNVAQTENAIQNIILEELENFEGIFMATTNLVSNMDNAFERRFLFKVEFDKPLPRVKAKIWKSKLTALSEKQCMELATSFDFTGGQIDNIVRKCETHHVLYGTENNMEVIRKFCHSETWNQNQATSIGFKREKDLRDNPASL